jgi:hypothetical protein
MSVHIGNIGELEFLLAATKRGLIVSRPEIQSTIYDFLIDNQKKILKIQVKATFSDGLCYALNIGQGNTSKKSYSCRDVDIIACYLNSLDIWYFLPTSEVSNQVKISLYPNSTKSKWNLYKGAWDLLLK